MITGTLSLWEYLKQSKLFQKSDYPKQGAIIISPTGTGNGKLKNGHVGFVGESEMIISNDSASGLLLENFTRTSWKQKYFDFGGFKMEFYHRV